MRLGAEDAIQLVGPGDGAARQVPVPAADVSQALGLSQEILAVPEPFFGAPAFGDFFAQVLFRKVSLDGDARQVRRTINEPQMSVARTARLVIGDGKGAEHVALFRKERRGPD